MNPKTLSPYFSKFRVIVYGVFLTCSIPVSGTSPVVLPEVGALTSPCVTGDMVKYTNGVRGVWICNDGNQWNKVAPTVLVDDFGGDIQAAIDAASEARMSLTFSSGKVYTTSQTINIEGTQASPVLPGIIGNGAMIMADENSSLDLILKITSPHAFSPEIKQAVVISGLVINGNKALCTACNSTGVEVNGAQNLTLRDITSINNKNHGFRFYGSAGRGIYYNKFEQLRASNNDGDGFHITSDTSTDPFRVNANTFSTCNSSFNGQNGWYIEQAQNTYVGVVSEQNMGYGFHIKNTRATDFFGGYSENNDLANLVPEDRLDFFLDEDSRGVKIVGGRFAGNIGGDTSGTGNLLIPSHYSWLMKHDESGSVTVRELSIKNEDPITHHKEFEEAWNPPPLSAGESASKTVVAVGAPKGRICTVGFDKIPVGNPMSINCNIEQTGVIRIVLTNRDTVSVDPVKGNLLIQTW